MKISVIGGGNIGGTLGSKWAAAGHEVVFGVRDPGLEKVKALLARAGHGATAVPLANAVEGAEVVLFSIPSAAMPETVAVLGSQLDGKVLIDATNNISSSPMHRLQLLSQAAPKGHLVRAFSNLGWENFAKPEINGMQVDLFYCGLEGYGQVVADQLISEIGLRPIYLGGLDQVDIVDALTGLWFVLALREGRGRHLALKMIAENDLPL